MGYLSDQPTKLIGMVDAAFGAVDHLVCGVFAIGAESEPEFP